VLKFLFLSLRILKVSEETLFRICRDWIDSHDESISSEDKQDVLETLNLQSLSLNFIQNALAASPTLSLATVA
jgi:hypothetical protein